MDVLQVGCMTWEKLKMCFMEIHPKYLCLFMKVAKCQLNLYDINYSQSANMLLTQWYAMVAVKY